MDREKCKACRYGFQADVGDGGEMLRACLYIIKRGTRRPCPAGANCTVWEPDEAGRRERGAWAFSGSQG